MSDISLRGAARTRFDTDFFDERERRPLTSIVLEGELECHSRPLRRQAYARLHPVGGGKGKRCFTPDSVRNSHMSTDESARVWLSAGRAEVRCAEAGGLGPPNAPRSRPCAGLRSSGKAPAACTPSGITKRVTERDGHHLATRLHCTWTKPRAKSPHPRYERNSSTTYFGSGPAYDSPACCKKAPSAHRRLTKRYSRHRSRLAVAYSMTPVTRSGKIHGELDVVTCRNRRRRCYRNMPKSSKGHPTGYSRCT